jgi:hypothetical protein
MHITDDEYGKELDEYRKTLGVERSSERLPAGNQPNSDLLYATAAEQYRKQQLDRVQSIWLNPAIPWKVFVTLNTLVDPNSMYLTKDVIFVMLRMASYRFQQIMSSAVAVEPFPEGNDVHVHCAIGSEANITPEWFASYLGRFDELRHEVLPYSSPKVISYVLKSGEADLTNLEPYLKPPVNARERRRLRRMR